MKANLLALLLAVMITITGCFRYSFTGSVPPHLKTVAIPILEDRSTEFGLRESLTDAIIVAYRNDNTLRVVEEAHADAMLTGTLMNVSDQPYTFTNLESVTENRITITVQLKLQDKVKGKTLFDGQLVAWSAYPPGNNAERQRALEIAVKKLADDAVAKTLSGW